MTTLTTDDLKTGIAAVLGRKKKRIPCHVNRISSLDDPCLRKLYYMRTAWDKAADVDDGLQGVFETGNVLEPVIERIVSEIGHESTPRWRIVGAQTPTNDALLKQYQVGGTIDGFLQAEFDARWTTLGVIDIKTMSANIFARINTWEDLKRYPWTAKYIGQVSLYALAHNQERAFLLLVNKQNLYDMKLIEVPVDMAHCEGLLQKAEIVNMAVATGEAPEGTVDNDACRKCSWFSICTPNVSTGGNLTVSDSEELAVILDRMDELQPTVAEYKALEKERDAMLPQGQDLVCGAWLITWKKSTVQHKAKEASESVQWRKKIVRAAA